MMFESLHLTKFHILICIIWQISLFMGCQLLFPIFLNYTPRWRCQDSDIITEWSKNCSAMHECPSANLSIEGSPFYSVVQEFEMYCGDRAYFSSLITTLQLIGCFTGSLIWGHLSDRFGRKYITIISLVFGFVMCCTCGLSPNWQLLSLFRFLFGISFEGAVVVGYTYVTEMILPEQRLFLKALFNVGFARIVFTFLCYLVPYWRYASGVTAAPLLLVIFLVFVFVPESPKWLKSRNKHIESFVALKRIAKFNKKDFDETLVLNPTRNDDIPIKDINRTYTIRDLFTNKRISKLTFTLCFMWFTTSLTSYGIDLNSRNLHGNLYINQFLMATMMVLSNLTLLLMDNYIPKFSRRLLHKGPQAVVCICYFAVMIMIIVDTSHMAITIINIIGLFFIEYTWNACYLCAAEGFPTVVRSIGVGTCSLMARIGAILAAQMIYLSNVWQGAPFAAITVCGLLSLILSYLYLPETKGKELEHFLSTKEIDETKTKVEEENIQL